MMQHRRVGRTDIEAQRRRSWHRATPAASSAPGRRGAQARIRAGVNWVHSAPDYGEVEPWIAQAIQESGRRRPRARAGPGPSDAPRTVLRAHGTHVRPRGWRCTVSAASTISSASGRTCGAPAGWSSSSSARSGGSARGAFLHDARHRRVVDAARSVGRLRRHHGGLQPARLPPAHLQSAHRGRHGSSSTFPTFRTAALSASPPSRASASW